MVKHARAQAAVVLLATVLGQDAHAVERPSVPHHRVGVDVGVASAVGLIGLAYQLAPVPWLRLEGGVGWGPTGTQLSVMPKIALGGERCRFTSGVGGSLAVGGEEAEPGHGPSPDTIPWVNIDALGFDCRSDSGLSISGAVGVTVPLVDFHYDVSELGDTVHAGDPLPQGRVGLGWWF